jgi:hypothetical protein
VQAHLGVTIPLARLLQDPTIAQLAQVVLDQIAGAPQAEMPAAPPAPPKPSASRPAAPIQASDDSVQEEFADVQDLSDEEVDALLRQMLSEEEQQA